MHAVHISLSTGKITEDGETKNMFFGRISIENMGSFLVFWLKLPFLIKTHTYISIFFFKQQVMMYTRFLLSVCVCWGVWMKLPSILWTTLQEASVCFVYSHWHFSWMVILLIVAQHQQTTSCPERDENTQLGNGGKEFQLFLHLHHT